jgi:flagellar biosynthesis component FlhA
MDDVVKKLADNLVFTVSSGLAAAGLLLGFFPGMPLFVTVPIVVGCIGLGVVCGVELTHMEIEKENREQNSQHNKQERQEKEREEGKEEKEREERKKGGRGKSPYFDNFDTTSGVAQYTTIEEVVQDLLMDTQKKGEGPKRLAEQLIEAYAFKLKKSLENRGNDNSAAVRPLAKSSKQMARS